LTTGPFDNRFDNQIDNRLYRVNGAIDDVSSKGVKLSMLNAAIDWNDGPSCINYAGKNAHRQCNVVWGRCL